MRAREEQSETEVKERSKQTKSCEEKKREEHTKGGLWLWTVETLTMVLDAQGFEQHQPPM